MKILICTIVGCMLSGCYTVHPAWAIYRRETSPEARALRHQRKLEIIRAKNETRRNSSEVHHYYYQPPVVSAPPSEQESEQPVNTGDKLKRRQPLQPR